MRGGVCEVEKFLTQRRREDENAEEMEVFFWCFSKRDKRVYQAIT